jgi:pimeloyl-ACP methyl ester carboxylesterase
VTSSYLYLNGLRVHYLRWDTDGPGRPVILLHDLGSNARIWERVAPRLAARALQPLAPDLRGHGLSDRPDGDYGFDTFYRDLAAFITASELERPVLVGHSWGALLALDYAARRSFGPLAPAAILLVDGGMTQLDDEPGGTWEGVRDHLAPPQLEGVPLETFLAGLAGLSPGWQPDDHAVQIYLSNFDVSADEILSPRLTYERHLQILRATWEYKTYERFDRVKCPVLLVPIRPVRPDSPEESDQLARKERGLDQARHRIADLTLHWMPEGAHDIPLQRPTELADLIADFIFNKPKN